MKKGSTWFLRAALVAMALFALLVCIFIVPNIGLEVIWELGLSQYLHYAIMIGLYSAAIPFFLVLYQTMKLLNYIDKNDAFSEASVAALKKIKYLAIAMSVLLIGFVEPVAFMIADADDAPGVIIIALCFFSIPFVIGVFAAVLHRLLRNAIDMKAENELTV